MKKEKSLITAFVLILIAVAMSSLYIEHVRPAMARRELQREYDRNMIEFCMRFRDSMNTATWNYYCEPLKRRGLL